MRIDWQVSRACSGYLATWFTCFALTFSSYAAPSQAGTELKIAFWNLRDLSTASRDSSELTQIAAVAHDIDCLAICELNDGSVLTKLKSKLAAEGGKWKRVQTGAKVGNTPSTSERYGFLYRSDKLKVKGTPHLLPEISYTASGESQERKFDREPFVCSFSTLDGRFDFTVLVVHITWGARAAYRISEVQTLATYFNQVQGERAETA